MSVNRTIEELAARIDGLGLWEKISGCRWALKRRGVAVPYFFTAIVPDHPVVRARILLLEGWQTLHDFLLNQKDRWFGVADSPVEMPHFEVAYLKDGRTEFLRYDSCYLPRPLSEAERDLVSRLLWQVYGVMMRLEAGEELMLRYVSENSMFARVEGEPDAWSDEPMKIVQPRPYVEQFSIPKGDVSRAKDMPFERGETMFVDFALEPSLRTAEPRPRFCYRFIANLADGAVIFDERVSPDADGGLKAMWEQVTRQFLARLVRHGRIPGEVRVRSGRLFRFLRPLCVELPFKLTLSAQG